MHDEHFETGSKKVGRGMAQRSLDLIEAMYAITKAAQPVTGRGVGYKMFVAELIMSMSTGDMAKVYRLLRIAREQGDIPWDWIVDETRAIERVSTWDDPEEYASCVARSYRRDFWNQQPHRIQVWSEKEERVGHNAFRRSRSSAAPPPTQKPTTRARAREACVQHLSEDHPTEKEDSDGERKTETQNRA